MFVTYVIESLDEQMISELLIEKNPTNLNTKLVDFSSMVLALGVIYFFRDLDFIWCVVLSVVLFMGLNRFLRFWYRAYVEVVILFNLDLLQLSDELKNKIKNQYKGEVR